MFLSFDLDSTLCDTRHRKGVIEKYTHAGLPIDWDDYAMHCIDDKPLALADTLRALQEHVPWVAVSGRSEGARFGTEAWLSKHGLVPQGVFLEDDPEAHKSMGHSLWKARRVIAVSAEVGGITTHFDDWPQVAEHLERMSMGAIKGVTVTPPGMVASYPDNPSA